jgi:hypothetical protein
MVRIASGRATATGASGVEEPATDDEVLAGWLEGLRLICTDLSGRQRPDTVQWLVLLTLEDLLSDDPAPGIYSPPGRHTLHSRVRHALTHQDTLAQDVDLRRLDTWLAPPYQGGGDWRLFEVLEDAGVLAGYAAAPRVTMLGRWLAARWRALAPVQILSGWTASAVLAQLTNAGQDADVGLLAERWTWDRPLLEAARQLLAAAAGKDAATRNVAVRLVTQYGKEALPAWHEVLGSDDLGPHARLVLSSWEQGPGPRAGDRWWAGVDQAAAALTNAGPDEALCRLAVAAATGQPRDERPGAQELLQALPGSGHPQAGQLAQALAEFLESGEPRSIEQQLQVTVRLSRWQPATWRQVLVPATDNLGNLDWVIHVLFGWSLDHLHIFQAGRRTFSDPDIPLDDAEDEHAVRLGHLFATGVRKLGYTYDLGAGWEHEIVLEKLVPMSAGRPALTCTAFAGDNPLEYPQLEDDDGEPIADPVETRPFRLDAVNATLASGHYVVDEEFGYDDDAGDDTDGAP